ncbi:unnamed protein product [Polarella glacialis]|uniref:Uncharacterized protein n=1 Tax=Polarella glacialis TaxID=89957 RepID=A0A813DKK5_POLGL|nr:unnamed protein product [Polarella glacialis]
MTIILTLISTVIAISIVIAIRTVIKHLHNNETSPTNQRKKQTQALSSITHTTNNSKPLCKFCHAFAIVFVSGLGGLKRSQLEILKGLVTKHLADPALTEIASTDDFTVTSIERGVPRYEHSHLIAALDVVLTYQRNRRAKGFSLLGARASMRSTYRHDPRTRLIELLKRWLRTHAANANIGEDEVRRMCGLCRDLLNYPNLFPSRNQQSFMHVLSEVYHLS